MWGTFQHNHCNPLRRYLALVLWSTQGLARLKILQHQALLCHRHVTGAKWPAANGIQGLHEHT